MNKVIHLKKSKIPPQARQTLDAILYDLERYGRTTSNNGYVTRHLAYRMKYPRMNGHVFIRYVPEAKKSIIALDVNVKLERVSDNKVRLIYESNFG